MRDSHASRVLRALSLAAAYMRRLRVFDIRSLPRFVLILFIIKPLTAHKRLIESPVISESMSQRVMRGNEM